MYNLQRNICRCKNKYQNVTFPSSALELILDDTSISLGNGENLLLRDVNYSGKRMLIFGSKSGVNFLSSSSQWFLDGTFDVVPNIFLYCAWIANNLQIIRYHVYMHFFLTSKKLFI